MKVIVPMPLDSVIQMMCTLNHVLNGEKLNVSDFQVREAQPMEKFDYEMPVSESDIYKSYNIENQINEIVRSGDTKLLEQWVKDAPTVRSGTLSANLLRQSRNTLIVNATIISRIAISCGMDVADAFKLSDSFIQRCENAGNLEEINALHYELVYTYTREVGKLKELSDNTGLLNEVYYYILHHISEAITTKDIAREVYMSRSHLSTLFKKNYGRNLIDYIHEVKIAKAKELLKDHGKSITQIADYLGYSSSSHFTRVFCSIEGVTPKEYRKNTPFQS
jgi:AraC-like DNA-binding protein